MSSRSVPTITAVVLTRNEQRNIASCLAALSWIEDIIVVDSGSTDATVQIAESRGARVFVHRPEYFSIADQRNWALDNTGVRSEWVLFVDADEIITDALRQELVRQTTDAPSDVTGFQLCYKLMFMGRWLRHTVGFPTWHDRLIRLGKARFKGGVWESFDTQGRIGKIEEPYLHNAFNNGVDAWIDRHQRYAEWKARELLTVPEEDLGALLRRVASGEKRASARLMERIAGRLLWGSPIMRFLYYYVFRGGFLDGRAGLLYSRMMGMYQFMTYLHVLELTRQRRGQSL